MNILSLNFGHDGLAAVVKDGKLVTAIASERLTRFKKSRGVNREVVQYVLDYAGLQWSDIHLVAVLNWYYDRDRRGVELFDKAAAGVDVIRSDGQSLPFEDFRRLCQSDNLFSGIFAFRFGSETAPCVLVDHHFAHCAYAYYMSPFDRAVVLSVDGSDNIVANHAVHYFDDATKAAARLRRGMDFDIGGYYTSVCDYLGFYPGLTDAGKIMALAAYGKPPAGVEEFCWGRVDPAQDVFRGGPLIHTLLRNGVGNVPRIKGFLPALKGEGGVADPDWLNKNDWRNELNRNIAATAQAYLEKSTYLFLERLAQATRNVTRRLCLSGGTMLNCVNNAKILHSGLFEEVFIAPACGDDGLAIGAALYLADVFNADPGRTLVPRPCTEPRVRYSFREAFEGGRPYSPDEIRQAIEASGSQLEQARVTVRKLDVDQLLDFTTDQIIHDRIVGWFYRGSELGPRALGHRSLLANPQNKDMKDILNHRVKHREEFRPFAPVILAEQAEQWFDLRGTPSPFMLFSVRCKKPERIPSAVHIDGTARVQTVDRENNGRFYDLVQVLHEKTGVPIVLNTSFNVQGEPIVESPLDAIRCFLGTNIDVLVLGEYLLEKKPA